MIREFNMFCKKYFDLVAPKKYKVLDHNPTSHASSDGVENYYIARISYQGKELQIIIAFEYFKIASSLNDMFEYIESKIHNAIFVEDMNNDGKVIIHHFFEGL